MNDDDKNHQLDPTHSIALHEMCEAALPACGCSPSVNVVVRMWTVSFPPKYLPAFVWLGAVCTIM